MLRGKYLGFDVTSKSRN